MYSTPGSTIATFRPELRERLFAVYRIYPATPNIVVTVIEHSTESGQLDQVASHGVFDQIVGRAAAPLCKLLQANSGLRFQMHVHNSKCKDGVPIKSKQLRPAARIDPHS